ncbi:MAG: hypothetical protein H8D37_04310 [Chloroflexi bacterium]|nr:hypothetical protein [Chloroflexota bacterium]
MAGITSTDPDLLREEKLQRHLTDLDIPAQHVVHLAKLVGLASTDLSEMALKSRDEDVPRGDGDMLSDIASRRKTRWRGRGLDLLSQLEQRDNFETSQMGFQMLSQLTSKGQELLLDAVSSVLVQALSRSPLVLFFEDAHWMDAASREILIHLQDVLKSAQLLILLAQRGAQDQPSIGKTINLESLDKTGTTQLVAEVLISDLAQIIHQHSKGNPLFIHEITQWIQQTWQISTTDVINALQTSDVLQNLVLSSLENLPETQRDIARIGSVIGEEFRVGELQSLLPSSVDSVTLYNDLRDLVDAHFISLIEAGIDPRYAFQQKLVRDTLYNCLPFARRRELHTRLAEYLVSPATQRSAIHAKVSAFLNASAVSNPVQDAKIVAYHYEAAEKWIHAARSLLRAADHLRKHEAYAEASEIYHRAISYLKNLPSGGTDLDLLSLEQALLVGQGDSALLCGDYSRAVSTYKAALAIPLGDGNLVESHSPKQPARFCLYLSFPRTRRG